MALAKTLQHYLDRSQVEYRVLSHSPTPSASRTAQASHVSGEKIAKGVLLKDHDGYTLAVLPASYHLRLEEIGKALGSAVSLATEQELAEIFADCAVGAVPAVGAAYGLDVVVDETVLVRDEICFEGGDHATLVCVSGEDFRKLMGGAQRTRLAMHD
jgi:Ala-tRNA(Pro) deacylase